MSQPFLLVNDCKPCKQTPKKDISKTDQRDISIAMLQNENDILNVQLKAKDEVIDQQIALINSITDKEHSFNKISADLKESKTKMKSLNGKLNQVTESKLYNKNYSYKQKMSLLKKEKEEISEALSMEKSKSVALCNNLKETKLKCQHEQTMKSKYKTALCEEKQKNVELATMLSFDNQKEPVIREESRSHRYSDDIRKTFYALQGEANVAASNCSKAIETVANHMFHSNVCIEDLPSATTSLKFSNEAHVIAKHQTVNEILNSDHFTFACDATSRQKAHYLEKHLILSNGKQMSLGFSEIASDDSETLLEQCVSIFKDLCDVYCLDDGQLDGNELLRDIIRKMTCLMSDRAAVMKAFNQKMLRFKQDLLEGEDCSIHFLFCNAHFLIALSTAADHALRDVEKSAVDEGGSLGRDSCSKFAGFAAVQRLGAAQRLIRLSAEVLGPRCDEKSGSKQEWLAYCRSKGIKSTFSDYRSNRFNNLFENATALLRHRHDILLFLNDFASHSNMKLQSVVADLKDDRIITCISVLSFLHVCLTEPYWKLMNSQVSYADFPPYVCKMRDLFDSLKSSSLVISVDSVASVFDDFYACPSDVTVVKHFISSASFHPCSFLSCLKEIVDACDVALKRQLSDFLEGGVFGGCLSEEVKTVLKTCPLTNLTGERLFGDLDYCMNKRRNASLILRSTAIMWKHNHTAEWLDRQTGCESKGLIERAIKYGPECKRKSMLEKKAVEEKVQARIAENKRKKDEKAIKDAERKNAALDALLADGGSVASTKEELDRILNGPKAVEKLKAQIRFRSLIRGEKITMTGTKKALYDRLLTHISQ